MKHSHSHFPTSVLAYDQLDRSRANRLLGVSLGGAPRPIDELIAFLSSGIASKWLDFALDHGAVKGIGGSARDVLLEGRGSAEQMRAVKEQSKRLLKKAAASQERLAAMAGYFIAIAASIVHHRIVPSDRPLADIREVLIDLATALPEPWSEMLGKAMIVLEEMIGGSAEARSISD